MSEDVKKRIKAIEEMIQVVLIAIPEEVSAQQLYLNAAEKATSEESKNLFVMLAAQEKGHEAELRYILDDLKDELARLRGGR